MKYTNIGNTQADNIGVSEAKREPEIAVQLCHLRNSLESLQDAVRGLGQRLVPITRPEPVACGATSTRPQPQTTIGTAIYECVCMVDALTDQVRNQTELTEV